MDFGLGINVFHYVQEKGIKILLSDTISNTRGAIFKKNGQWYIQIDPHDTIERQCFTIAHELAEIELDDVQDISIDEKHHMANYRAGEILLPDKIFKPLVFKHTLHDLKNLFPTCSYEVLARRIVVFRQVIVTIYDNKSLTLRIGSEGIRYPIRPDTVELEIINECYEKQELIRKTCANLQLEAYYIAVNPDFQRVILLAFIQDEF